MNDFEMKRKIYGYIKEICHYSQMQVFATSYYQKNYFQMQIDEKVSGLVDHFHECMQQPSLQVFQQPTQQPMQEPVQQPMQQPMQEPVQQPRQQSEQEETSLTAEQLAYYDGTGGKPAYVAVNGIIYDVSMIIRWAGGTHFGQYAGRDLSGPFMECHMGMIERLQDVPKIGMLIE